MYAGEVLFHSLATPAQTYPLPGFVFWRNMDVIVCLGLWTPLHLGLSLMSHRVEA